MDIASRVHPKLTSVSLAQEEIGRQAAQVLMDRLQGRPVNPAERIIQPELVVRASSVKAKRS